MTSQPTPGPSEPMTLQKALTVATGHHQAGRWDQAERVYRAILAEIPDEPNALHLLGLLLHQRGNSEGGAELIARAVAARPRFPDALSNLGSVLRGLGRLEEAVAALRRAVELRPAFAQAHFNLGNALTELGRWDQADEALRRAIEIQGDHAAAHANLGNVLREKNRHAESIVSLGRAIELDPSQAGYHVNLGKTYEELGELARAERAYRQALQRDPRAIGAWYRLALDLGADLPEADLQAMADLLADAGALSPRDGSLLHAGLAHVRDARGEYARAADHARCANELLLAFAGQTGAAYDPDDFTRLVDRTIATFTEEYFARTAGQGAASEMPVFVIGMPRSGTTLTERILASHPEAFGGGELTLGRDSARALYAAAGVSDPTADLAGPGTETLATVAREHLRHLEALGGGARRVVDKMPENYLRLGLLTALLPEAKIVHTRRDPRDVALSCWITHFEYYLWSCRPAWIARRIADYQRLMAHWHGVLPSTPLEVDYEQLVADLPGQARRLVEYVGLTWDPACLAFHRNRAAVQSASLRQVRRPVHTRSVGRWRNYRESLADLFEQIPPEAGDR